jgi:uncharacterized protein YndB with AHSA1/START domain
MTIQQTVTFRAPPAQVYQVLTDGGQFSQMCGGAPAQIGAAPGDAVSLFGGMIVGRQIELKPAERLVQTWRAGNWPDGVHSVVRFELAAGAGGGTTLQFEQHGYPTGQADHLGQGWQKMYWEPMQKLLG